MMRLYNLCRNLSNLVENELHFMGITGHEKRFRSFREVPEPKGQLEVRIKQGAESILPARFN